MGFENYLFTCLCLYFWSFGFLCPGGCSVVGYVTCVCLFIELAFQCIHLINWFFCYLLPVEFLLRIDFWSWFDVDCFDGVGVIFVVTVWVIFVFAVSFPRASNLFLMKSWLIFVFPVCLMSWSKTCTVVVLYVCFCTIM